MLCETRFVVFFHDAGLHVVLERLHLIRAARLHADWTGPARTPSAGVLWHEEERPAGPEGRMCVSAHAFTAFTHQRAFYFDRSYSAAAFFCWSLTSVGWAAQQAGPTPTVSLHLYMPVLVTVHHYRPPHPYTQTSLPSPQNESLWDTDQ